MEDLNIIEKQAYDKVYNTAMADIEKGFFLNINACKANVRKINQSMRALENGAVFASSLEEVNKVNTLLAKKRGRLNAYKAIIKWHDEKVKAYETDR
jgi:hypothetical protein